MKERQPSLPIVASPLTRNRITAHTMTSDQIKALRDRIASARQPEHNLTDARETRGWNGALDHVEKIIRDIMGEK